MDKQESEISDTQYRIKFMFLSAAIMILCATTINLSNQIKGIRQKLEEIEPLLSLKENEKEFEK